MVEEILGAPRVWNEVPDLMMEVEDERMMPEAATKRRREEVARGRRKQWREDDIRLKKLEHSPNPSKRTHNPAGFYSQEWGELQQEDDEWQVPDTLKRISQMVFCGGCLEIHPSDSGCLSRLDTQHE